MIGFQVRLPLRGITRIAPLELTLQQLRSSGIITQTAKRILSGGFTLFGLSAVCGIDLNDELNTSHHD